MILQKNKVEETDVEDGDPVPLCIVKEMKDDTDKDGKDKDGKDKDCGKPVLRGNVCE